MNFSFLKLLGSSYTRTLSVHYLVAHNLLYRALFCILHFLVKEGGRNVNIIICDDDEIFSKLLDLKVRKHLETINIACNIKHFLSGEALLEANIPQVDLVFLDIRLAKMNGIEIAVSLRKRKPNFVLVFISGLLEYAPAGYAVNALRYVLKDQLDILFAETMEAILQKLGYFRKTVDFDFIYDSGSVYTDEIIYIESKLHTIYSHFTKNAGTPYLYSTLNDIEKMLPAGEFIRIHQSYLVNLSYFLDARNYRAILINKIELPISQKKFADVKKRLFLYRGRI